MRKLAAILSLLLIASIIAVEVPGQEISSGTHRLVSPVRLTEAKWTDGFWHQCTATCRDQTIPAMWEIMQGTKYKPYLEHFRIAAGLSDGNYHGAPFNDGDFYKWMEAVCAAYAADRDAEWDARLDEIIGIIANAQRKDGYIHTPVLIANRNGNAEVRPFGDRFNFEMYNMGHLMTAACVHHEVTGKDDFLAIACKAADFLDEAFRNPTPQQATHAICPSHYMGLVDLYRATNERRYLNLAERLIRMRDQIVDGGDDNQDRVPLGRQTEAVGHSVRATYLYAGIADLYAETGDEELWKPLSAIWSNVVEKKMYITGGCGALYDGASPDGSKNQGEITRVHQAFGRNYQLPNITAHNETCANIGNVLWNWRMFLASGDAKYVDIMELSLYNSVLSGVALNGTDFFYTNPLRQQDIAPVELRWSRTRVPYLTSFCCPPNVARTICEVNGFAYGRSERGVWVNLFGSSTLDTTLPNGDRITLRQETDYPWNGRVNIAVETLSQNEMSLFLRIPGWADGAKLLVNDKPHRVTPGAYAEVRRLWKGDDVIELVLPMQPQLVEAHPLVEEIRNQIAVKRGPIVYCLESTDLPADVHVGDVAIPLNATFTTRFDNELLGGVTVLEGKAEVANVKPWGNELYRPFKPHDAKKIDLKLIPYFKWSNRGKSEMTVWMPLGQ
ncbi:glycoside hydrolase family 127 protein [Bremerella sp.]|uniref:aceric acid hydrolase n=1 Tax=Bremerella sp. TaxID=2795602 RepID=UPI00391D8A58